VGDGELPAAGNGVHRKVTATVLSLDKLRGAAMSSRIRLMHKPTDPTAGWDILYVDAVDLLSGWMASIDAVCKAVGGCGLIAG
jgi:hypothetical protein